MIQQDWEREHLLDKVYLMEEAFLEEMTYLSKKENNEGEASIIIEPRVRFESLLSSEDDERRQARIIQEEREGMELGGDLNKEKASD